MRGSGETLVIDRAATVRAIIMPYSTCLWGYTGDVIGSGTITTEKKITVGSNRVTKKFRSENALRKKTEDTRV